PLRRTPVISSSFLWWLLNMENSRGRSILVYFSVIHDVDVSQRKAVHLGFDKYHNRLYYSSQSGPQLLLFCHSGSKSTALLIRFCRSGRAQFLPHLTSPKHKL